MGGVVNPNLRVYGCRNLRVCDASNIPMMPQANTQAVVYGVAKRAAEIIKSSID
jgi:choline dehydrogenase-like flavoprotein